MSSRATLSVEKPANVTGFSAVSGTGLIMGAARTVSTGTGKVNHSDHERLNSMQREINICILAVVKWRRTVLLKSETFCYPSVATNLLKGKHRYCIA